MGVDGTVPAGSVSDRLLRRDPDAPFGVRLDQEAVVDAFRRAWTDRAVVLVEASDLVRAGTYAGRQTPLERTATLDDALANTDRLVGGALMGRFIARTTRSWSWARHRVVPTAASPSPRSRTRCAGRSDALGHDATRRLRAAHGRRADDPRRVGRRPPATMRGRPFTVVPSTASAEALPRALVDGNEAARFRSEILVPVAIVFTVLVAGLLAPRGRRVGARGGGRRGLRTAARLALATLGYVAAVYLARLLPSIAWGSRRTGGSSPSWRPSVPRPTMWWGSRRRPLDALIGGLAALVGLLVGDVVLGSHLQFDSGFGFSPEVAGRFIGFGNVSYAVLAVGERAPAGLLAHRVRAGAVLARGGGARDRGRRRRRAVLGCRCGGVLTMVPAFALAAVLLFRIRVRIRTVLLCAGATLGALTLATIVDLAPAADRTHLARLVEQIGGEGSSAFTTVLHRKLQMSLSTLSSSQWRPMVPLVLAFVAS